MATISRLFGKKILIALCIAVGLGQVATASVISIWIPTGNMTVARVAHTATLLNNGKVLVTGGYDSNPETEVRFQLPEVSYVVVKIFNTLGEEIRTLVDGQYEAGYHVARWDGRDKNGNQAASGVYLYQLRAGNFSQLRKMSLLR